MLLRRRRGGLNATRKMAKKATPAALQTDVATNEDFDKILEREGLVVVDIYSEWAGPCTGMVSILKKIKMELGGDILSYAIAKCDSITSLQRFRGKSEPTWMFIHNGKMINLMFGARCPQLLKMLTDELERIQKGDEYEFCIPVDQPSPEEEKRSKIIHEATLAKEAAKKAKIEAEIKAKYEAEMNYYCESLKDETCLLLYPWVFKDEENKRRDKKSSPPYVELIDEILPGHFAVCEEVRRRLNEEMLDKLFLESDYVLEDTAKQFLLDGKCLFMRLKSLSKSIRPEQHLLDLIFGKEQDDNEEVEQSEPVIYFVKKHKPAFATETILEEYPIAWAPLNPRNKSMVFKVAFRKYLNNTWQYEDKAEKVPIMLFKYDSTRRHELKMALELHRDDALCKFGIFERDKPDAKMIGTNIEEFEMMNTEKTGYETFVCTVKKVVSEAFLTFAGIGPYHVSENPEKALEESKLYFPMDGTIDEVQSDDEEKIEETGENVEGDAAANEVKTT